MQIRNSTRNAPPAINPISRFFRRIFIFVIIFVSIVLVYKIATFNISSDIPEIKSGISGYCLDAKNDSSKLNSVVQSWSCDGTDAQNWVVSGGYIVHDKKSCLSVMNNGTKVGDIIVSEPCANQSGQIWITVADGFENPTSSGCLTLLSNQIDKQLILGKCTTLTQPNTAWMPSTYSKQGSSGASLGCNGNEGQKVACIAAKQWSLWNSGTISHNTLLNNYSDGNSYEEWCADFVSYVYRQAGYPFTSGERDGWDEYYAPNIQNQGFAYHSPGDYTPQPGDIAYFDYNGGHVEIVLVGGTNPIFIYGDSGTTDKTTDNGDMAENTITNDGYSGQLIYYLSPN